jgi:thiol-disulfide isomerase/thioredoxin
MRRSLIFIVLIVLAMLVLPVSARQAPVAPGEPQTLAECLKAVRDYAGQQYKATQAAGRQPDLEAITREKLELAGRFARRFPLDQVQGKDLEVLARLLVEAGDAGGADRALAARLATPGLGAADQAEALMTGVEIAMTAPITEAALARAAGYAARLDALPGAPVRTRVAAHARLGGYYRGVDVDEQIAEHMSAVLALAGELAPADRQALGSSLVNAYTSLAEVYGDREQADQAITLLKRGLTDLSDIPAAKRSLPAVIARYGLVGTRGAPIEAPDWLNAEPGPATLDPAGRVTLLQFTAHWCGPCRKSYPTVLKLYERFAPRGLRVVFSTQYYGFFEKQRSLAPKDELAADRQYFVEHHGLPFKIAIEPQKQAPDRGEPGAGRRWTEDKYFVAGIPQIVVLDRRGIIRLIVIGWDQANEGRLAALIERLLAEPATN